MQTRNETNISSLVTNFTSQTNITNITNLSFLNITNLTNITNITVAQNFSMLNVTIINVNISTSNFTVQNFTNGSMIESASWLLATQQTQMRQTNYSLVNITNSTSTSVLLVQSTYIVPNGCAFTDASNTTICCSKSNMGSAGLVAVCYNFAQLN